MNSSLSITSKMRSTLMWLSVCAAYMHARTFVRQRSSSHQTTRTTAYSHDGDLTLDVAQQLGLYKRSESARRTHTHTRTLSLARSLVRTREKVSLRDGLEGVLPAISVLRQVDAARVTTASRFVTYSTRASKQARYVPAELTEYRESCRIEGHLWHTKSATRVATVNARGRVAVAAAATKNEQRRLSCCFLLLACLVSLSCLVCELHFFISLV